MTDFRIYPSNDEIFPWAIDSGTKADEARVLDFNFYNISGYTMKESGPCTKDAPKKWIVARRALLEIFGDIAHFYGEDREQ